MNKNPPAPQPQERTVTLLTPEHPPKKALIRIAAYCRVSSRRPEQEDSFFFQQAYFRRIYGNSDTEELVGIYADHGLSGTASGNRPGFQRMLADCRSGRIDRIVCKSISRFARNLRDCLMTLRELKLLGITVFFEKENLDTAVLPDEIMLTIMEGLAQEESASISRNTRWSLKRRMRDGTLKIARVPYGYRKDQKGDLVIDEEKADVIRRIFRLYLSGCGARRIAKHLNEELIPSPTGIKWGNVTILKILAQEKYTGDILWQKTWSRFMGPKWQINHGDADSYYIRDSHPAIIDRDTFQRASEQRSLINRSKSPPKKNRNPFRSKLTCSCGRSFLLFRSTAGDYWKCSRATDLNHPCDAPKIRDADIRRVWEEVYAQMKCGELEELHDRAEYDEQTDIQIPVDTDLKKSLQEERESIYSQRYLLRKHCLEERITPSQLAESEAELDQKLNQLKISVRKSCVPEADMEEAYSCLQKALFTMSKEVFLKEMLKAVTISYDKEEKQTTAIFHMNGGVQYRKKHLVSGKNKSQGKEESIQHHP